MSDKEKRDKNPDEKVQCLNEIITHSGGNEQLEKEIDFDKARTYLKKIKWMDDRIDALIEDKKSYIELATKTTSNLDGNGAHSSGCQDKMAEIVAKIADIENEIAARINRLVDYKNYISKIIDQVQDTECQKILYLKFARYMTMDRIAEVMTMDRSSVYRKYNKGIRAVQEILSDSDKG